MKSYLEIGQMPKKFNLTQKQKLARKVKHFILKKRIMYKVDKIIECVCCNPSLGLTTKARACKGASQV